MSECKHFFSIVLLLTVSLRSCKAILQGHTSLVGQLQMRDKTLVTGGSDGSVRVWSLDTHQPEHRLAAHDNSVTSLQFDAARIVSGGSDGRVKVWDRRTGALVRELSQPAEAVWRVAFEDERCVVLASRQGRTVMEVWDFSPPPDDNDLGGSISGGGGNGAWSQPLSRTMSAQGADGGAGPAAEGDTVMVDVEPAVAGGEGGSTKESL